MSDDFNWEKAARDLWQLLDDIDTLTDACKGSAPSPQTPFGHGMYERLNRRHQILHSDGYELTPPSEKR